MTLPGQNYSNTFLFLSKNYALKLSITWVANIAPRYRLCLPSCGCGFQSQAHHLRFFNLYNWNCNEKRTKINEKEAGIGPFLKKTVYHLLNGPFLLFQLKREKSNFYISSLKFYNTNHFLWKNFLCLHKILFPMTFGIRKTLAAKL